jgi:hypothetical protein
MLLFKVTIIIKQHAHSFLQKTVVDNARGEGVDGLGGSAVAGPVRLIVRLDYK